jgi:hypothetical protein
MRWFSKEMFFPRFVPDRASVVDDQRVPARTGGAHAFVNWQTKQQLDVEYMLNARATILDCNTVRAAGRAFTARILVSGWVPGRCGAHPRAMTLMTSTSGSSIQANSAGPASTRAWTENSGSADAFATTRDMDGRSCWVPGLRSRGDVCQRRVGP